MQADQLSADEIFAEALRRPQGSERANYLDEVYGLDVAARERMERLLRAHADAQSFLESSATDPLATVEYQLAVAEGPGTLIGSYKLLQQIGEGGMGVVFMAEQTAPVRRRVALKIIKPGMDTKQVIARFEAERQALALMDHPNIARVFDAGSTESGRPYFIMELVHGVPITEYCNSQKQTPSERLRLFIDVCRAVQHAHQKGIIHRDLKPSNIMVTMHDDKPVPKIIDFGVSKAISHQLTEKTLFTAYGQMIGTPIYMSPEQAQLSGLDAGTRSDIYSLGVLLYELVTSTTPFDEATLKRVDFDEMRRMIREEEPPKPSTRLSSSDALASIAVNRGLEPLKLNRLVQGELDWIVMKSLEKDRNRRYETASDLAADVQCYLNDETVHACPPSRAYRFRKFIRRSKGPALAASVALLALIAGVIGTTWGMVRAEQQRHLAEVNAQKTLAAAEAEKIARQAAHTREAETEAILEFVQNKIFAAAQPEGQEGGLGRDVTLRRAVEAALPVVETSFTDQPLVEARLRMTLGISFDYLGEAEIAAEQYEKARTLFTQHLGPDHHNTLASMGNLALSYDALGRYADAVKLGEENLALMKSKLGLDHPDTLSSMNNLANSYNELGRHADALILHEETRA